MNTADGSPSARVYFMTSETGTSPTAPVEFDVASEHLASIRSNADLMLRQITKVKGSQAEYDRAAVYAAQQMVADLSSDTVRQSVSVIGSFLGEAIIANSGGCWKIDQVNCMGVKLPNGVWCYPFHKVEKQIANGLEDGIASFYDVTLEVAATATLEDLRMPR